MKGKILMIQGTSSGAGKSTMVVGLCRLFSDMGYKVCPFKSQNMTSNLYRIPHSVKYIAKIQAIQAVASRKKPDIRMNPIILKPLGDTVSDIFIGGTKFLTLSAHEYYENFVIQKGLPKVLKDLDELRNENDIIIIEGAGSPVEINISKYDIANMVLAETINSPVLLISDIERGGCFASLIGTLKLLKINQRKLVKGIIINKFRGEKSILHNALLSIEIYTKKKVLGIIPMTKFKLPNEDSLDHLKLSRNERSISFVENQIDVVANAIKNNIDLSHIKMILEM